MQGQQYTVLCHLQTRLVNIDDQTSGLIVIPNSPKINHDMSTVKRGAELLTVSAKLTATKYIATKPNMMVPNLLP